MNTAVKTILGLVVVGAVGYGAVQLLSSPAEKPPEFVPIENDDQPTEDPNAVAPTEVSAESTNRTDASEARREVDIRNSSGAHLAQGVRGYAVNEAGQPLAGVQVVLRKVVAGGFIGHVMQMQKGLGNAPLALTETDENGLFELGLHRIEPAILELWFTGPDSIDTHVPSVEIKKSEWRDMGNIELKRGAILYGRVIAKDTGAPIEGAMVTAKNPMTGGMSPPPGREDGVVTETDANGMYRFENLVPGALLTSAVAEGYARMSDHNTRVSHESQAELNFELPEGLEISGVVIDGEGNPIAGAQISTVCLSTKTPMKVEVRCDREGRFTALGLVDAPFQLNASAPGFLRGTEQPVQAGADDVEIVLEKQGGARVRVVGKNGRVVKNFYVTVMRHFPRNDQYGAAHDVPPRNVRPRDLDNENAFQVTGMNPGEYAFMIDAGGFARTRSEPFTVSADEATEIITVKMKAGGEIQGIVLGPEGQPMANVVVATMPPGVVEVPFLRDLQHLMVTEITKTQTKTRGDGTYRIKGLAAGKYQIKMSHPDVFVKYVRDVEIADEQTTDIEQVQMERGTEVYGRILVDGKPGIGVKVSISTTVDPNKPPVQLQDRFSDETVTNELGEYRFPRRVPPGDYTLRAGRTQGNPLLVMLDYKKTEQQIVFANQDSFDYSPSIVSQ